MRKKLKIALIFGGTSAERVVSLNSGLTVAQNLDPKKYDIIPVEIAESGNWLANSPTIKKLGETVRIKKLKTSHGILPLEKVTAETIDVALLALHGPGGEDGTIQGMLDLLKIPYTCSGVLASSLGMDKIRSKRMVGVAGVRVLPDIVIVGKKLTGAHNRALNRFSGKIVIKPSRMGSSLGVTIAKGKKQISKGIAAALRHDKEILLEPFIEGREITVPVLGNSVPVAFPAIEIVPWKKSKFYDYAAKYQNGGSEHLIPAPLTASQESEVKEAAVKAHIALGCRGVTRSDFILGRDGKLYFLEINTIPGMTPTSLVPQSARVAGISFTEFLDSLIKLALEKD